MLEKYSIKFTPIAIGDLNQTYEYISRILDNPTAAVNLMKDIDDALGLVAYNPEMYPLVKSDKVKLCDLRRMKVKKYLIFYHADHENREIKVYRVIYEKRKYEDIL